MAQNQTPNAAYINLSPTPAAVVCGNCGSTDRLHHIRDRTIFRRLCTSCVLRLNPSSFCPTCFTPPPHPSHPAAVTCSKCYSISHPKCASAVVGPYVCPLCRNPGLPVFNPKRLENGLREIDEKSARILLAAATIASSSMEKAAEAAKAEAERRAREAAFAKKKAKEALEHIAYLQAEENAKESEPPSFVEASGNTLDGPSEVSARLHSVGLREIERVEPNNGFQRKLGNGGEQNIGPH